MLSRRVLLLLARSTFSAKKSPFRKTGSSCKACISAEPTSRCLSVVSRRLCVASPVKESSNGSASNGLFDVDYERLTKGDAALLTRLKVLMLEIEVMRQDGRRVPSKISNERWAELLEMKTRSQREKLLSFLWLNEKKKEKDKQKKAEKKLKYEQALEENPERGKHIHYGFGGSTIFIRVYNSTIDNFYNNRLMQAVRFGQKVVVDCGYSHKMTNSECSNCAKQLSILFAENRVHVDPFNLYFCNADPESVLIKKLIKVIPNLYSDSFPSHITDKSYLDIFPKKQLVYLTPHCKEELSTYSHDDIYIIGGMVDKVNNEPLSLAKAKREGLRMAKLPLDAYLDWAIGTKSLTLNQVLSILLDMKVFNDWEKAFVHVPQRKLR